LRVLFADDHKVMCQGLIRLIFSQPDIQVAGEAHQWQRGGRTCPAASTRFDPNGYIIPEMDGIEATRRIKSELPDIRVIGLPMHTDEHILQLMRNAGAVLVCNHHFKAYRQITRYGPVKLRSVRITSFDPQLFRKLAW